MAWHTSGNRMDTETDINFFIAQFAGNLVDDMLSLGNRHSVTRDNHNLLCIKQQFGCFRTFNGNDLADISFRTLLPLNRPKFQNLPR